MTDEPARRPLCVRIAIAAGARDAAAAELERARPALLASFEATAVIHQALVLVTPTPAPELVMLSVFDGNARALAAELWARARLALQGLLTHCTSGAVANGDEWLQLFLRSARRVDGFFSALADVPRGAVERAACFEAALQRELDEPGEARDALAVTATRAIAPSAPPRARSSVIAMRLLWASLRSALCSLSERWQRHIEPVMPVRAGTAFSISRGREVTVWLGRLRPSPGRLALLRSASSLLAELGRHGFNAPAVARVHASGAALLSDSRVLCFVDSDVPWRELVDGAGRLERAALCLCERQMQADTGVTTAVAFSACAALSVIDVRRNAELVARCARDSSPPPLRTLADVL